MYIQIELKKNYCTKKKKITKLTTFFCKHTSKYIKKSAPKEILQNTLVIRLAMIKHI